MTDAEWGIGWPEWQPIVDLCRHIRRSATGAQTNLYHRPLPSEHEAASIIWPEVDPLLDQIGMMDMVGTFGDSSSQKLQESRLEWPRHLTDRPWKPWGKYPYVATREYQH